MLDTIHFIITGGTIDCYFDPVVATTLPNKESCLPDYFKTMIKPYTDMKFETICMKDSRDLNDSDRLNILFAVKNSLYEKIIISHGTDAMQATAEFLMKHHEDISGKTIILTGAFIPIRDFAFSDAGFNLGFAVYAVKTLVPGIYTCMNAEIFKAGEFAKDKSKARFAKK